MLKHSCVKLLRGRLEPNPHKFSGTTTQYLLGRDEEIFGDLCIFLAMFTKTYRIIQEERALGMHNLRFVPKFCDFFSCRPAKYTRLPAEEGVQAYGGSYSSVTSSGSIRYEFGVMRFPCNETAMSDGFEK